MPRYSTRFKQVKRPTLWTGSANVMRAQGNNAVGPEGGPISRSLEQQIDRKRGTGLPLEPQLRTEMEDRFQADFSTVRVHSDAESERLNRQLSARAFTAGDDIFLGRDTPPTESRTITHELAHVVQQQSITRQDRAIVAPSNDPYEYQARSASNAPSHPQAARAIPASARSNMFALAPLHTSTLIQRDVGSDSYNRGYQDALNEADPNPGPLSDYALADYNEGYAKGRYDVSQQATSSTPAPPSNTQQGPAYTPGPPTDNGPNQTVALQQDRTAYQIGYSDGKANNFYPMHATETVGLGYEQDYTNGYNDAQRGSTSAMPRDTGPSIGPTSDGEGPEGEGTEAEKPEGFDEESYKTAKNLRMPEFGRYTFLKNAIRRYQTKVAMGLSPEAAAEELENEVGSRAREPSRAFEEIHEEYERLYELFGSADPDPVFPPANPLEEEEEDITAEGAE